MSHRLGLFVFCGALSVATVIHPSRRAEAQAVPAEAQAGAHFARGVSYYNEADYSAALVEFKRAYAIAPTWRVLFNIGQAYFQLHEYVDALNALRQFVTEGGELIKPKQREITDAELADLLQRVGQVSIDSNLGGATVSVDDQVVGVTPLSKPVAMSAGIRKVTATHEGRSPVELHVSVVGGEATSTRLEFGPVAPPTAPEAATAPEEPPAERAVNRVAPGIAFGVFAVGAGLGSVFGAMALQDRSTLDRVCTGRVCPSSSQPDIDAITRDSLASNIAFGVAIVGAVTGITLWLTGTPSPASPRAATIAPFSVVAGPGFVAGTF
jgi:hypothetical protein